MKNLKNYRTAGEVKGEDVVMAVCGYIERKRGETSLRVFEKPDGKLKLRSQVNTARINKASSLA